MAKQLNVALDFTANTTQAKQQIQELQQLLTKVAYSTDLGVSPEQMQKASAAAKELAIHLNEAYNATTGNYDLSKLNASLARSKTNVTKLSNSLLEAGATGQQAFIKLAQSIAAADQPMITLNARLQDFLTTVKNTVKWQISSSMIHGVMGALQGAYGYAQDLNKSLNDIRIVTGHNIDYMDKFAEKANKAAKALSTSTLDYTDASLIYYQQGLSDQEVEDRTAVTIKMANAAGESADKVSQQLTAVWNNFYDGSQSLEYYADVMTALGAATASSTDEIAEGLEKFAAVSNTVGLSYEYATSALATVTATTRQSADVVGTAFKTLFARIQDLELGETLDDGTTLGKYSQALDAVGVEIKDATGGLRDMDDILSDLGEKWNSFDAEGNPLISKDAKVALAQTVAGVRQYTQLMALMDNWDFMKENLETARDATGTLNEQQKIYEEGWKAANERLKASFQSLYTDLINDKFFIKFTNFLSDIVDGVDSFIDKIGGVKTLLIGILGIVAESLSSKITPMLQSMINNIKVLSGGSAKIYGQMREEMNANIKSVSNTQNLDAYQQAQLQGAMQLNIAKQKLAKVNHTLTDSERQLAEVTIQGFEMSQKEVEKMAQKATSLKEELNGIKSTINDGALDLSDKKFNRVNTRRAAVEAHFDTQIDENRLNRMAEGASPELKAQLDQETEIYNRAYDSIIKLTEATEESIGASAKNIMTHFIEMGEGVEGVTTELNGTEAFDGFLKQLNQLRSSFNSLNEQSPTFGASLDVIRNKVDILAEALPTVVSSSEDFKKAMQQLQEARDLKSLDKAFQNLRKSIAGVTLTEKQQVQVLKEFGASEKDIELVRKGYKKLEQVLDELEKKQKQLAQGIKDYNPKHLAQIPEVFMNVVSSVGNAVMAINSFKSAFESLSDPDLSGWEKFSSFLISISFAVPMAYNAISTLVTGFGQLMQIMGYTSKASLAFTEETGLLSIALSGLNVQLELSKIASQNLSAEDKKAAAMKALLALGINEKMAAEIADTFVTQGLNAAMKILNGTLKEMFINLMLTLGPILLVVAAVGALGYGIYKAIQSAQDGRDELKDATEDLDKLKTNLDKANASVQETTQLLDSLPDKYDKLKDMTVGTAKWRQAVFDLNTEVQKLIDKYGLIRGEDYFTDDLGVLRLTDKGEEKSSNKSLEEQQIAATAASSQSNRTSKLNLQDEITNLANDTEAKQFGTKTEMVVVSETGLPDGSVYREYEEQEVPNWVKLQTEDIQKVIQASLDNNDFNVSDYFDLKNLAGLSSETIELIQSNDETIKALEALTVEAAQLRESYENSVLNELLARGLDLSGYEEGYRGGIGLEIAKDVIDYENKIIESYSGDTKLGASDIKSTLVEQGYDAALLTKEVIEQLIADGTVDITTKDAEGNDQTETLKYDTILANYAAEQSRDYGLSLQDNYYAMQTQSEQASKGIEEINQTLGTEQSDGSYSTDASIFKDYGEAVANQDKYGSEGFRDDESINKNEEAIKSFGEQIESVQPALADMFGIIDENDGIFDNMLEDGEFLKDNAALLQKAFDGDSEAVNDLREKYNEYVTDVKKSDLKKWINEVKDTWNEYRDSLQDTTDITSGSEEINNKLKDSLLSNSEALSKVAGMSKTAFETYVSKGQNAAKMTQALQKASQGYKSELVEIRQQLGREFVAKFKVEDEEVKSKLESLSDYFAAMASDDNFKIKIQNDPQAYAEFLAQCNQMVAMAGMTAEDAQNYFKEIGFDTVIKKKEGDDNPPPSTSTFDWMKFDHVDAWGVPQYVKVTEELEGAMPEPDAFAIESITPSGSAGGDITLDNSPLSSGGDGSGSDDGSSGGGGYKPPPKKEYDDEIERYHVIKQQIEDLQEVMDHLAKAKDRAFGTSKLELMDQEIEKYGEMIDLQNQYLAEIEEYWQKDRDLIASYGAIFDETGVIINYDEIMKRQIDKYNSSIGFNEDADDAAEDAYDDFIEALEQYEETNNLRQDELEKLYDLQTELADVIFEKTQYKIEIKIAVKDDELEYLEYLLSKIEDDAYAAAEAIALMGEKAENALEKTKIYSEGLMELLSNHGINSLEELDNLSVDDLKAKEFTEDEIDQIREWKSSILEANQELLEMRDTIQEKVLDSFDQFSEDLQEQMDLFEHYQNILESVKDITSLLGTELTKSSKEVIRNLNRAMLDNNINSLASQKTVLETYQEQQKQAQAAYDHAKEINDADSIRQWEETLSEIDDKVHDAEEEFLSIWQETLEQARDIYEEEMDNIAKDFEEGISPIYGAIDVLQDTIGRAREINEQYLEDYEKTYELNKLARQIQGSIDDTDIISNKKKLSNLQDEINKKLKDGTKLSEYDLKILQQKYELELAHQALDDAKNGNERVRLARDGNGNWGYIYTADEDKIAEAEQNYEDKLKAMQDANKEYLQTLEDNILTLQQTWQQAISEINLSYANGEITKAEQEARIAEINEYYATRMEQLEGEYKKMFSNSQEFAEKFQKYFKDVSLDIADTFDKTSLAIKTGYTSLSDLFEGFWRSHDSYLTSATMLLEQYREKLSEVSSVAGTISSAFASEANGWAINITGNSKDVVADVEKIAKNATDSFNQVLEAASDFEQMYADRLDEIIKKNEDLVTSMREMIAALSGLETATFETNRDAINNLSTTTANNRASTMRNSETFNTYRLEQNENSLMAVQSSLINAIDNFKPIEIDKTVSLADTYLESLDIDKILQYISSSVSVLVNQLGGLKSFIISTPVEHTFEQTVNINADFPNATDSSEILEAFDIMEEEASQFANKKSI